MVRSVAGIVFSFLVVAVSVGDAAELALVTPEQAGMRSESLKSVGPLIGTALARKQMPGCVVLIGRPTGIAYLSAYGNKRIEPEAEPMSEDTVFDLASLTKPLATATSVMKLVEQGRITLDDPVVRHLPEFGVEGKESITVRDLLVHRSGLIPDNPLRDYFDGPAKAKERLLALKLTAPVGSSFMYSDVNFMILGELVARVAQQPLDEFVRQEIFEPLEMTETMYRPSEQLRSRAAPTEQRDGAWLQGEVHDPRAARLDGVAGHAGLFGTARDLAKYAADSLAGIRHDKSRILKQSTWRTMTEPHVIHGTSREGKPVQDTRSLGWDKQSRYSSNRGTKLSASAFGHGGFTGTSLWIDPENQLFVIFLSNRVHPNGKGLVNPLAGEIADLAVGSLLPAE